MQPRRAIPRDALSTATVEQLIRDDSAITVTGGLEVIDKFLNVLSDVSDYLQDGEVEHSSFATLHNSFRFKLSTQLNWANAIVRPYQVISNGTTEAKFYLGAYYTSTPERGTDVEPPSYEVEGTDILLGLDSLVGDSYAVYQGTTYLSAVETILLAQGFTQYSINQNRASTTLPASRAWPLDDKTTWLSIINDLLAAIGYRGLYSDWNGKFIIEPYVEPNKRQSEWTYDTGSFTAQILPGSKVKHDYFRTPNRWVGVRNNNIEADAPIPGDGVFEYVNQYDGETSIDARSRVISAVYYYEAADQNALKAQVMSQVESDMDIGTEYEVATSPNPLHWHFDRLTLTHPEIGTNVQVTESQWSLPLFGGDMQHTWRTS